MCLDRTIVESDMVTWGMWKADNENSYGSAQGYSTDGKTHHIHLKTGACGGGNKLEHFEEMPEDVARTDAMVSMLSDDHKILCGLMFVHKSSLKEDSIRSRTSYAKGRFIKKYKKSLNEYRIAMNTLWSVLETVLDKPKLHALHPYREKNALQCAS